MNNKGRLCILTLAVGVLGCVGNISWACTVPYGVVINQAGMVALTEGRDQDMLVNLRVNGGRSRQSGYQFGYMTGDTFSPITNGRGKNKSVTLSVNGPIDFALRNRGSDSIFGSADDVLYKLSDSPTYASQHYFDPIKLHGSNNQTNVDFTKLTIAWDTNRDGIRDLTVMLQARKNSGGMHFVDSTVPVPLPAALWLLGSGIAGLFTFVRRRS
jgi:hypothetical protein